MYDVFISYRSKGGQDLAGRIKDRLVLEGFHPFYNSETMNSGRYDHQLFDRIDECQHFLLVLPHNALNWQGFGKDWVREEIRHAIQKKKHIIIVQTHDFHFPRKLPASIDIIRYMQTIDYTPTTFDFTIQKVVEFLRDTTWSPNEYDNLAFPHKHKLTSKFWVFFLLLIAAAIGCIIAFGNWNVMPSTTDTNKITTTSSTGPIDRTAPTVFISQPKTNDGSIYVQPGGTIIFTVSVSDNKAVKEFNLTSESIQLGIGLYANIDIVGSGNERTVVLSNISGQVGAHSIFVLGGCAVDEAGNKSFILESGTFYIVTVDK